MRTSNDPRWAALAKVAIDYFAINKWHIIKQSAGFYLFLLLGVLATSRFAVPMLWRAPIFVLIITLGVTISFSLISAYLLVWAAAKRANRSMMDYIVSDAYKGRSKDILKGH